MELSPTMHSAINFAKKNGDKLIRQPGGFWRAEGVQYPWFGSSTINALVDRGVAEYTQWQERKNGGQPFPIEMTLKEG